MNSSPLKKAPLRIGALNELLGFHLRKAQSVSNKRFDDFQPLYGLTYRQFCALALVACNEAPSQSDIAQLLDIERSTMVVLCDALKERGLIEMNPTMGDRRRKGLSLTPSGKDAYETCLNGAVMADQSLCGGLNNQEKVLLMTLLRKLTDSDQNDSLI